MRWHEPGYHVGLFDAEEVCGEGRDEMGLDGVRMEAALPPFAKGTPPSISNSAIPYARTGREISKIFRRKKICLSVPAMRTRRSSRHGSAS